MDNFSALFGKKLAGSGGGSGTDNYNELSNKPQINGNSLTGNKTGANLGLQDVITSESKLSSDLIDDTGAENLFVSASEKSAWSGKQEPATTLAGYGITDAYTKTETDTALLGKQGTLSQSQLAAANSGITAEKLTADEAALAEVVDNGAKNLLQLFQLGSSNANTGNPCTSQGVEYEIQSGGTITAYRKSSASSGAYIFLYKNGAIQNVSEFFDGKHIWSGNPPQYPDGGVSIWYKIGSGSNITLPNGALLPNANGEAVQIGFQISTALSPTQSNPIVFKPMICAASDWAVSQKYVPYAPTNRELYEMIQALQNGTRYAPALAKAEPEEVRTEPDEEPESRGDER